MIDLVLVVILMLVCFFVNPKSEWGYATGLFAGTFAMFIAVHAMYPIPNDGPTMSEVRVMLKECEQDLPRNQKCVIDVSARPPDANGM